MAKAARNPAEGIVRKKRAMREVHRGQRESAEIAESPARLVSD